MTHHTAIEAKTSAAVTTSLPAFKLTSPEPQREPVRLRLDLRIAGPVTNRRKTP